MLWTFHPKGIGYTFFSTIYMTFYKIKHMLGHKTSFNKFKRIEIISSIFSDHNGMKLEINYMKKTGIFTNRWWPSKILLTTKEKNQKRIKKYLETRENGNVTYKNLWNAENAVHSYKYLLQEMRKVSNNLTLHLKELKKSKTKPKARRKKIKIQAEISEVET